MGFKQTTAHRFGKHSYHQIGLVRGQFGNVPFAEWLKFLESSGFDGWEEASWELDLRKCDTDAGAAAYAQERLTLAKQHNLEIFTVATHLQGQALGDEPSAKTLQFIGGDAVEAYKAWRASGKTPPRTDPYYVPEEVGKLIHEQATRDLQACVRLAHHLSKLQNRRVALPGFVGSPAGCWSHWFLFPPLPTSIGGYAIEDVRKVSLELLAERFAPVFDLCKQLGVTYDLECHPSERAMGDIESAHDYLEAMDKAGYAEVVGFNLDGSHMEWQNVSVIDFIREFPERIHCAHVKGVWVAKEHVRAGRLGGHRPMGHWTNGWNFVTAGTARDANSLEEIFIELNRIGYDGAVSIEWEDNDAEQHAGARTALANCHRADNPPSGMRHDEMLKA
ncbi:sugar phosphate isomerase/epimerase family protein [Tuwongella immobilis]|uniref:Xylose isomerase-like TIM barrel domain-containing protein n=1 Tax=Tuwongella immobilis TaxID=692036 RepID=A0A6C2YR42_9BACT|nr:sugar phosphate isomerase/epimerase [Tuwongella immobilis]VIP03573.1 Xylose isomerase domain protein TIM barrel OS=Rhodothermus marinus (strain ATCC 43812 / DSM 4252 / R-10) GN=Rmar_1733 PE=4 SV=1: AP_endonuc_2: AP_endonuc_2_N [Tuwongella immobilis]VTS04514.1 Xylose isomerase domain protein TIM barrel OS=Rhodothermus marinus (strain ATCC 43812 / DSM 4252 / R-10) GN=Rmar_1733 PE=4 SV=1: AP_endonuc_2: AP_endonuc_2_N [Tuwongella immobilis]